MSDSEESWQDRSIDEPDNDADWEDWGDNEDGDDATRSLFDASMHGSVQQALEYDGSYHAFSLPEYIAQAHLNDYDIIRVVNYIRAEVAAGRDPRPILAQQLQAGDDATAPWKDDLYLTPVVENDPMLFYEYTDAEHVHTESKPAARSQHTTDGHELQSLRLQNQKLRDMLDAMRSLALSSTLASELEERSAGVSAYSGAGPSSRCQPRASPSRRSEHHGAGAAADAVDRMYFASYSRLQMHLTMLADKPRTEAYQHALTGNPSLLRGSVVMDVGCGSGILSLFAAQAGASSVIGVDGSDAIASCAREVIAANGHDQESGGSVRVVCGKLEELDAQQLRLPHRTNDMNGVESSEQQGTGSVDVIVSEWMGYGLLFESMLHTVLTARDRFLRPGGAVLPDIAEIHVAGAHIALPGTECPGFWEDVYGFNMSCLGDKLAAQWKERPTVGRVETQQIVTDRQILKRLDLATMSSADSDFTATVQLTVPENHQHQESRAATCNALVIWFDVEFSSRFCPERSVTLTTGPGAPATHWEQLILPFREPMLCSPGAKLCCLVSMARGMQHRTLDIAVELQVVPNPTPTPIPTPNHQTMSYQMGVDDEE